LVLRCENVCCVKVVESSAMQLFNYTDGSLVMYTVVRCSTV
jgi:hypothetical protein